MSYNLKAINDFLTENSTFCELYSYFSASDGLRLNPVQSIIYSAIYNFTVKQNLQCYLSLNQFVELTGVTKKTVIKAIDDLEKQKLIIVYRGYIECGRPKNTYDINLETLNAIMFGKGKADNTDQESPKEDSVEITQTIVKNYYTPSQKLHEDSVEITLNQCKNSTKDSVEITLNQCKNSTKDSRESTPYNIINKETDRKEDNNIIATKNNGGFAASSTVVDGVSEKPKKKNHFLDIRKVVEAYPIKAEKRFVPVLESNLDFLLDTYTVEQLIAAGEKHIASTISEVLQMNPVNFYGKGINGNWRFIPYLPKE